MAATEALTIELDGRAVDASWREPVLAVARRLGIEIPTLCHEDYLEPAAACRLCLVEVERRGRTKIVTACNFPVEEGMRIHTQSETVLRARRMTLEALLARCPEVPRIQALARRYGVSKTRLLPGDDTCILCGLCTRVCDTYVTSAIATLGRSVDKYIGTFAGQAPEACVGCGACAAICPTDHIRDSRSHTTYEIWGKGFPLAICAVDAERCRGCGACEQACPFGIPRVILQHDGSAVATIRADACKACGVCLAACPSGAIEQPLESRALPPLPGVLAGQRILVIACGRANLHKTALPAGVQLLHLSCTGGVSPGQLLGALACGYDGVLVLGRHEESCRLRGAETHARRTVDRIDRLAQLCGLGAGRLRFAEPAPGPAGPLAALREFAAAATPNPLQKRLPQALLVDTVDGCLAMLGWLGARPELEVDGSAWLAAKELPAPVPGESPRPAGLLPYYDILLEEWLLPEGLAGVLAEQGAGAGVVVDSAFAMDPDGLRLTISPDERRDLELRLLDAEDPVRVCRLEDLIQLLITRRTGSWRRSHVQPRLVLPQGRADQTQSREA